MTTNLEAQHSTGCLAYAYECLEQNAVTDGQAVNDWGFLPEDPSPWGRGATCADVVAQWLADGTFTCQCPDGYADWK